MEYNWERSLPFFYIDLDIANKLFKENLLNEEIDSIETINEGCRSSNYVLETNNRNKYILKIFPECDCYYERESKLLNLLKNEILVQKVYLISSSNIIKNKMFGIYQYVEGVNLGKAIRNGSKFDKSLINELAITLAKIHKFKYKECGKLDKNLKVIHKLSPLYRLYEENMGINFRNRLGNDVVKKINHIVNANKEILLELDKKISLIHGDFQGTNILIKDNKISAIIDWEFSMAGNSLIDIGQLFRYEDCFSHDLIKIFEKQYNKYSDDKLIDEWYKISKLIDLISLIKLINTKEDMPNKHKEIKKLIINTLELF
ncbi:aminoglycoside phosphotransferase family protein [Clostridium sp. ZS2]|uniref:phosphotransferase family protein n=1 Tax=Clostridium sp. ZS2 TaxID=2949988 RepID=UPI0013F832B8|nr:aminoglycoside phosphotransferase family protein [Clostridium sp. ZS2]NFR87683.1 aminoglycoside phosphotransferase family protein [Clostridium botulinum]NFR91534.1 aminoglycoside phosphotransferase family protein [Clostridium botulinum]NFU00108.1 aminoglycoside phosphotransferase family protein [Clostridium botulinum]